jgi:thiol-disulfide isomerase/thioredoxin
MPRKRQTKVGRVSTMDVRSKSDVSSFESLLGKGPLTIVLVYADWCGHCQTFKQNMWNEVSAMPNKKVNTAAVHYDMVENTSLKNAKIEGYPSLLLVGTNKEPATFKENATTTNAMPTPQNVNELKNMVNTPIETPVSNANTVASNVVANATNTNTINNNANTVNTNTLNTNLNVSSLNNTNSQVPNINNSMAKNVNSYVPANGETLEVPDTNLDIPKTITALDKLETERTNPVKVGGGQQQGGSSLMSTLLKVTQEAAHAGALLLAANEYAGLAKRMTRKYKKKSKKTKKNKQRR